MTRARAAFNGELLMSAAYWLAWTAVAVALLAIIAAYGSGAVDRAVVSTSDALIIPSFARDLFAQRPLDGWEMSVHPYLVPDMALFVLVMALVRDLNWAVVLFGVAQLLLLACGLLLLQRRTFGVARLPQTLSLCALALFSLLVGSSREPALLFALISAHHFGVIVLIPFGLCLLLAALQSERPSAYRTTLALLLLFTMLASLSEFLFMVQFVAPAVGVTLLWALLARQPMRRAVAVGAGLVIAALAGNWVRQLLASADKLQLYTEDAGWANVPQTWARLAAWAGATAMDAPLLAAYWISSCVALLTVLGWTVVQVRRGGEEPAGRVALIAGVLAASMLTSLAAVLYTGNFEDKFSTRYLLPLLVLPLLTGWPLFLGYWLGGREDRVNPWVYRGLVASALGLIAATLFMGRWTGLAASTAQQDPFVACLQREAAQRNIRRGLAEYWQAMSTSVLSGGELELVQVKADLTPYVWYNNRRWYEGAFEFVVIDRAAPAHLRLDETRMVQKFGEPAERFTCGESDIFVYNRPTDVRLQKWFAGSPELAEFDRVGEPVELYGYALPSHIGGLTIGLSQGASDQWGNIAGILGQALLRAAPAGEYTVAIQAYAGSPNTGAWRVIATEEGVAQELAVGEIAAAGSQLITATVSLLRQSDMAIEVEYVGHGALFLDKVQVTRGAPGGGEPATEQPSALSPAPSNDAGDFVLLHPEHGSFISDRTVDFAWQWTGRPLPPGLSFEVRLWPAGDAIHYGAHDALATAGEIRRIDNTYLLRLDLNGAHAVSQQGPGDYWWTVGVVTIEPAYQDRQMEAPPQPLFVLP
jgi:hypothetical protein